MEAVYFVIANSVDEITSDLLQACPNAKIVLTGKKADKGKDLSAFSFAEYPLKGLLGQDAENLRFFFPEEELTVYASLAAANKALCEGASAVVCLYAGTDVNGLPAMEETKTKHVCVRVNPLPSRPALTDTLRTVGRAVQSVVFYDSEATRCYLAWAVKRFFYIYQNGYSSIADTVHTGAQGDREAGFHAEWMEYLPLFGVGCEMVPAGSLLREEKDGPFPEYFDEGTVVHPLLKPYFARNYRLRIACQGNPFAHRPLFTDTTVVTGEESGVPLTAIADCIWQNRPDLQAAFPCPRVEDREGYLRWFVANAAREYGLEEVYTAPVRDALEKQQVTTVGEKKSGFFRRRENKALASSPVQYETGVNLCAHIRGEYGIGEASRMLALTLQTAGEPFTIVDFASERDRNYSNTEWLAQITNSFPYSINVMYTNADGVAPFLQSISPDALKNRYNIGFWAWEMPEFPDEWLPAFEPFDEIWTLSQFSADAIASKSPIPVYNMPHPVVLQAPEPRYDKAYFDLPQDSFLFLAMYDVRSVPERKNPMAAVKAFLREFEGRRDAALILKVNAPAGWEADDEIAAIARRHDNIHILDQFLSRAELNGLLASCDAYVSLHRSEGFGFGPAEAMYYGKPAVVTGWSGSMEYAARDTCCLVSYEIVALEKDCGPYRKGWHWAEPDIADAATQMKRLAEDPEYRKTVGQRGQKLIKTSFSPESISCRITARIAEIESRF